MFKIQELEEASSGLSNQLDAGLTLTDAVVRMAKLQPKKADLWLDWGEKLARGARLSDVVAEHWPEGVVASVRAGEMSGNLPQIFKDVNKLCALKLKIRKSFGKLIGPVVSGIMGLFVFIFFMVGVIPKLQSALGGGEKSFLFKVSTFMHDAAYAYWHLISVVLVLLVIVIAQWLRQPENIGKLIALGDSIPVLNKAMRNLFFGTWAYQLAILDEAGLPVKQQLLLSLGSLPEVYKEGVLLMAYEVEKRGRADSADPEKQEEGDPRRNWPYYIAASFINAHETGRLDKEMARVAPILIDEGVKSLDKSIAILDVIVKFLVAGLIAMPLMAYFTQMSYALTKAFS